MQDGKCDTVGGSEKTFPDTGDIDPAQVLGKLYGWNVELMSFYMHRCQQYWTLPVRWQACTSVEKFTDLQMDFLRELADDYQDAAAKLSEIAREMGGETAEAADYSRLLIKAQEDAAQIIEQAKGQAERIVASAHSRAAAGATDKAKPLHKRA